MEPVENKAKRCKSERTTQKSEYCDGVVSHRPSSGARNTSKSKRLFQDLNLLEYPEPPPLKSPTASSDSGRSTSPHVLISVTPTVEDVVVLPVKIVPFKRSSLILRSDSNDDNVVGLKKSHSSNDTATSSSHSGINSNSTSREKLVYKPHRDGYMNENRQSFDTVNFCFLCDTVDPLIRLSPEIGKRNSESDSLRPKARPRSVSANISSSAASLLLSAKKGSLKRLVVKTGYKLTSTDGPMPVYRTVFLCPDCLISTTEATQKDNNYSLRISENALSYF